jgi:hypothetical protein
MTRRQIPARLLAVCGIGLASTLACGSSDGLSSYSSRKSASAPDPGSPEAFEADDAGVVAPPDRALLSVRVVGQHEDAPQAQAALKSGMERVMAAAKRGGCAASIEEYTPTRPGGWAGWRGQAQLRLEIDLREAADVPARMAALDACMLPVAALTDGEENGDALEISLSAPLFGIDDPSVHTAALWARHAERLDRVSVAGPAPQLHPEDLRCVSRGDVSVLSRSITGVRLGLDLSCRTVGPGEDGLVDAG